MDEVIVDKRARMRHIYGIRHSARYGSSSDMVELVIEYRRSGADKSNAGIGTVTDKAVLYGIAVALEQHVVVNAALNGKSVKGIVIDLRIDNTVAADRKADIYIAVVIRGVEIQHAGIFIYIIFTDGVDLLDNIIIEKSTVAFCHGL